MRSSILVYGAPRDAGVPSWAPDPNALFPSIGRALTQPGMSASLFGTVIRASLRGGWHAGGSKPTPGPSTGSYAHVKRALNWFLKQPPGDMSESTKAWARATLPGIP